MYFFIGQIPLYQLSRYWERERKNKQIIRAMARILLLLLVWILRHTLGDIEQRFEQSDFMGEEGRGLIYTRGPGTTRSSPGYIWYWNGRYYLYRNMFCLQCWVCCCILFNWIYFFSPSFDDFFKWQKNEIFQISRIHDKFLVKIHQA